MEQPETKVSLPRIGELAPDFEATTTHGTLKLSDFAGKWVILFSHPADFTPVCTTEFVAFAKINDELVKRNVKLIGLSIDRVYSHIAWTRRIKEKLGVEIPFPVIADLDMKVANLYGMIHPEESTTSAIRCDFFLS
jgi:peroxiredoxin (alkyl hydroperoxide reductase subunit C)